MTTKTELKKYQKDKKWIQLTGPLSLSEALHTMTKDDLEHIRKFMNLKGVSKLKKADLIEKLIEEKEQLFLHALEMMDLERFKVLEEAISTGYVSTHPEQLSVISWWRKTSLLFSGIQDENFVLVLPTDYQNMLAQASTDAKMQQMLRENEEFLAGVKGLTDTYGVLRIEELFRLLEELALVPDRLSGGGGMRLLQEFDSYHAYYQLHNEWIADLLVDEPKKMLKLIDKRKDIPMKTFSKEEIVNLGKFGELPKTKEFEQFETYLLTTFQVPKPEVADLLAETVVDIRNDYPFQKVMEHIVRAFEFSSKAEAIEFSSQLTKVMNSTPRWALKGHAPLELTPVQPGAASTEKTVGRNEPCPCGSEKKFKKCCGK
ncbi:SEC-C metal-binding domain-containing protein [Chryseomicrobium palamuruense]|uniref:SEC-C metal-binding domain-containing protein n=1 Tax=Chryseomicrobium palamuruense TaxID=682973 RepID=A0ABV8UV72_9BACL